MAGEAPVSQYRAASDHPPTNAPSEATTGAVMRMDVHDDDSDTDYLYCDNDDKGHDDYDDDRYDDSDDEGDDDDDDDNSDDDDDDSDDDDDDDDDSDDDDMYFGRDDTDKADEY